MTVPSRVVVNADEDEGTEKDRAVEKGALPPPSPPIPSPPAPNDRAADDDKPNIPPEAAPPAAAVAATGAAQDSHVDAADAAELPESAARLDRPKAGAEVVAADAAVVDAAGTGPNVGSRV